MGKRARRKFTPEYKAEVVKMVKDGGKSIGELSRDLGVADSGIRAGSSERRLTQEKAPLEF